MYISTNANSPVKNISKIIIFFLEFPKISHSINRFTKKPYHFKGFPKIPKIIAPIKKINKM